MKESSRIQQPNWQRPFPYSQQHRRKMSPLPASLPTWTTRSRSEWRNEMLKNFVRTLAGLRDILFDEIDHMRAISACVKTMKPSSYDSVEIISGGKTIQVEPDS